MTLITLECSLNTITIVACLIISYQFCNSKKDAQVLKIIKYLCAFAELLCVCAVTALDATLFWILKCNYGGLDSTFGRIGGSVGFLCYTLTLTLLYTIFSFRIYFAFIGSIYHLSKQTIRKLICVLAFQFTINMSAIGSYQTDRRVGL